MADMWTLDETLTFIRQIQPDLQREGYAAALGGGVLNRGVSENDLDLIIYPLDTMKQDRERVNSVLEQHGLTLKVPLHKVRYHWVYRFKSHDQKHVEKWETSEGKKVDVFLLS